MLNKFLLFMMLLLPLSANAAYDLYLGKPAHSVLIAPTGASGNLVPRLLVASDIPSLSYLSTMAAVGAAPNANGATIAGSTLTLQPFDSTNAGLVLASGGGTTNFLRADGTWTTPGGGGGGTVTSVTGTAPVVSSGGTTPAISMAASTNAVDGYLTSGDHTTFAAKQDTISTSSAVSNQFVTGFTAPNTFTRAQPAFTDISGTATIAQQTIATQAVAALAIDWSTGSVFTKTLSANSTFTFSNIGSGQTIVVRLTNTASNFTVTWPGGVLWSGGTAPTQTVGAKSDIYTFVNDGSTTYGSVVQNF